MAWDALLKPAPLRYYVRGIRLRAYAADDGFPCAEVLIKDFRVAKAWAVNDFKLKLYRENGEIVAGDRELKGGYLVRVCQHKQQDYYVLELKRERDLGPGTFLFNEKEDVEWLCGCWHDCYMRNKRRSSYCSCDADAELIRKRVGLSVTPLCSLGAVEAALLVAKLLTALSIL